MAQEGISVILCPASPLPALTHGATLDFGVMGSTTVLYNVLGFPAGVVPWTRVAPDESAPPPPGESDFERRFREVVSGSAGLPMGVQVVARPWRDHEALAAMAVIEAASRATGEHPGRPPL
jgi:fatty acid amide hydrolase